MKITNKWFHSRVMVRHMNYSYHYCSVYILNPDIFFRTRSAAWMLPLRSLQLRLNPVMKWLLCYIMTLGMNAFVFLLGSPPSSCIVSNNIISIFFKHCNSSFDRQRTKQWFLAFSSRQWTPNLPQEKTSEERCLVAYTSWLFSRQTKESIHGINYLSSILQEQVKNLQEQWHYTNLWAGRADISWIKTARCMI